jgi:hypothetical protein
MQNLLCLQLLILAAKTRLLARHFTILDAGFIGHSATARGTLQAAPQLTSMLKRVRPARILIGFGWETAIVLQKDLAQRWIKHTMSALEGCHARSTGPREEVEAPR